MERQGHPITQPPNPAKMFGWGGQGKKIKCPRCANQKKSEISIGGRGQGVGGRVDRRTMRGVRVKGGWAFNGGEKRRPFDPGLLAIEGG